MGFWSKVKGVFGRIGNGIKSGWNWLTKNKDTIADVVQKGVDVVAPQYSDRTRNIIDRGQDLYGKTDAAMRRLGIT